MPCCPSDLLTPLASILSMAVCRFPFVAGVDESATPVDTAGCGALVLARADRVLAFSAGIAPPPTMKADQGVAAGL